MTPWYHIASMNSNLFLIFLIGMLIYLVAIALGVVPPPIQST